MPPAAADVATGPGGTAGTVVGVVLQAASRLAPQINITLVLARVMVKSPGFQSIAKRSGRWKS
jgi:hypothetical protein